MIHGYWKQKKKKEKETTLKKEERNRLKILVQKIRKTYIYKISYR